MDFQWRASHDGGNALQVDQAFHVEGHIGHPDLRRGSRDADGSDEQTHAALLLAEDMLDAGADLRFEIVGAADGFGHGPVFRFLAVDPVDEAVLLHEGLVGRRPVGGVGPHAL